MKFFFDRCLSPYFARMVDAYERSHEVVPHDDKFAITTPDTEWIAALAKDSAEWVVVTGDPAMLRKPVERDALARSGLKFFYFAPGWQKLSYHEQGWRLLRVWPKIVEAALRSEKRVFEVSSGRSFKVRAVS